MGLGDVADSVVPKPVIDHGALMTPADAMARRRRGDRNRLDIGSFSLMPGVRDVVLVSTPYKLASHEFHPEDTVVRVGDNVLVGGMEVAVMAGPCAVESEGQIEASAAMVAGSGAQILRGGAFKPRSSPYSYQGLGVEGLKLLRKAADKHGLAVVTEVMTIEQIETVSEYADLLQVGARNMQNYPLLTALGHAGKPVLLKGQLPPHPGNNRDRADRWPVVFSFRRG